MGMNRCIAPTRLLLALLAALLAVAFLPSASHAAPASAWRIDVRAAIERDAYVLTVTGVAPAGGAWLGRSAYAYGIRDKATEGVHEVVSVLGDFRHVFTIPVSRVRGGSYEVALWSGRVMAAQCTIPRDTWCKRNGYHLTGLLAYRGGWFPRTAQSTGFPVAGVWQGEP